MIAFATPKVNAGRAAAPGDRSMWLLEQVVQVIGASAHRAEVTAGLLAVAEAEYKANRLERAAAVSRFVELVLGEPNPGVRQVTNSGALQELARKVASAYPTCAAQVVAELREDAVKGTAPELVARVVAADALQWALAQRQAVPA